MLRKGAFIMRVRKADSDAIELYESSQVKFKTTGTMREVQFSAGVNKNCAIQNISKDTYPDKATSEIKGGKHNTNRYQSPSQSTNDRIKAKYHPEASGRIRFPDGRGYSGGSERPVGCIIKEMMKAEMDNHLGYEKSERSDSDDYRNGYKPVGGCFLA